MNELVANPNIAAIKTLCRQGNLQTFTDYLAGGGEIILCRSILETSIYFVVDVLQLISSFVLFLLIVIVLPMLC